MTSNASSNAVIDGAASKSADARSPHWALELEHVGFCYPASTGACQAVLLDASLRVPRGAFALLTGGTGSGKTTLMRLCKPELAPAGSRTGSIRVLGHAVEGLSARQSAQSVGYVFQSPDNQTVCDTVWHEMAFGLENLGIEPDRMRRRIAEVCYFLGMESLFRRPTSELSGGQRQTLALAATLVLRPGLLLLDEPTSMLDPIAEKNFLSLLFRVNRELGCTVVVATHSPAPMVDVATNAFEVKDGAVREVPLENLRVRPRLLTEEKSPAPKAAPECIRLSDCWLRYARDAEWVLRGCDLTVRRGEVRAIVGGNGSGKSTLLRAVAGTLRFQRGRLANAAARRQVLLPQNPKALLACDQVGLELMEWSRSCSYTQDDAHSTLAQLGLDAREVWERHPFDLSGGQLQLVAMVKLLLAKPDLLLLDEPTKGLDLQARRAVARAVQLLREQGKTVLLATHDLRFAHEVCDTVSLLFDGSVSCTQDSDEFFQSSWLWRDE